MIILLVAEMMYEYLLQVLYLRLKTCEKFSNADTKCLSALDIRMSKMQNFFSCELNFWKLITLLVYKVEDNGFPERTFSVSSIKIKKRVCLKPAQSRNSHCLIHLMVNVFTAYCMLHFFIC